MPLNIFFKDISCFCLTSVYGKTYLKYKMHMYIYNCHSKRIGRDSKNLSSLDVYNSKTIFKKNIYMSPAMRKTVIEISLIVKL